ncbi:MAG: hypothetical protein JHD15_00115 [Phenylobacterium sp.]|uniref:LysE family translocator n=1 Tax=Phenylobacterium sp. TaxID=1871053 RepID=UPI001A211D06|nr:hypothetical protein [Phenylobacterium sp.]MBJ7408760.1 hypothetical protein [Phenylobacterium sp.]
MTELDAFVLAAALLLLTPGPTNTLLAAAGAILGARQAAPLIAAELLGYGAAILVLEAFVAPVVESLAWLRPLLRIACAVYLAYTAWRIWTAPPADSRGAITWGRVFLATLSNPKALIFVFVILPPRSIGVVDLVQPYLMILFTLMALAGSVWVALGAAVRAGARGRGGLTIRRTSSVVVALFSALLLASAAAPVASAASPVRVTQGR